MALTWDLTKIKPPEHYKIWIDNPDPEKTEKETYVLNALSEVMIFASMFVGMPKITKTNYKEFYTRLKQFEIATGQKGLLVNHNGDYRMPTREEVEWHIGLETNATAHSKRKWSSELVRMLNDTIRIQERAKEAEDKIESRVKDDNKSKGDA